jgi:hypothetical protein
MRRRTFLQQAATLSATAIVSGPFVHAASKSDPKNPVIGGGEHQYACFHDWGQLPSHIHWETTHGVTVDESGFVYIKQQGHQGKTPQDTIVVFDATGKFVRSFGKEYYPGGHGIDIRKEGSEEFLYLSDVFHNQVIKTSLKGEVVWKLDAPKEPGVYPGGKGYRPTNVAFAPDGGFYVGDGYGSHYIHQYTKEAKWVRTWGGVGEAPGKMRTPHGIWLDSRPGPLHLADGVVAERKEPALVVADRANARLQYFALDGTHLGLVKGLLFPAHFDIRGDVLLVPDLHARVSLFDKANRPIVHLGDDADWRKRVLDGFKMRGQPAEWVAGKFIHPHDACFDSAGNIYVVEWVQTGRVTFMRHVG